MPLLPSCSGLVFYRPSVSGKASNNVQRKNTLTKLYIDSLKQITTFQIDELKLDRDQVSEKETENDRQFLLKFVLSMPSLHTQVAKLIEQAKKARVGVGSKDF